MGMGPLIGRSLWGFVCNEKREDQRAAFNVEHGLWVGRTNIDTSVGVLKEKVKASWSDSLLSGVDQGGLPYVAFRYQTYKSLRSRHITVAR